MLVADNTRKRELVPLKIGDSVQVQNQTGNHPGKWNNTGVISGVLPNRQYQVVTNGSRRVTLRNRRFLKKILPVSRKGFDHTLDITPSSPTPNDEPTLITEQSEPATLTQPPPPAGDVANDPPSVETYLPGPDPSIVDVDIVAQPEPTNTNTENVVRRSTRPRAPRNLFNARMVGKTHE